MVLTINKKELLALIFVLILASFFRLWKLDAIPPGLYPDEAINANEAISSPGKVFYKENNGREGLFINLISLSFKVFGINIWALKIVPAFIGILTVLGVYFLTKELFQNWNGGNEKRSSLIALFSSFFLAVSFWHVNFSRISFRAILVPLISVFAFYFLLKAMKRRESFCFVISGIFFGLGLYTYISFRMIFLLLPFVLFFWYQGGGRQKTDILTFLKSIFIVSLPWLFYFANNPQDFVARAGPITVFAQENPLGALLESSVKHLAMFNFYGDSNWRHNISSTSVLFWPVGILFLFGFFYSCRELLKSFKKQGFRLPSSSLLHAPYFIILSWWFVMLLPGILTYEGIPHSLRTIGVIPPTFILAGLGGMLFFEFIKKRISVEIKGVNSCLIIFSLFLLGFAFVLAQYNRYFQQWAGAPETKNAFSKDLVTMGHYLNSLPENVQKYVIVNLAGVPVPFPEGIPMPAQTPMFIERTKFGTPHSFYLRPENLEEIVLPTDKEKIIIVLMKPDSEIFSRLGAMFPGGSIKQENGAWIYEF